MNHLNQMAGQFLLQESGQDMVEYGLILGLLALSGIASLNGVATSVGGFFSRVGNLLTSSI